MYDSLWSSIILNLLNLLTPPDPLDPLRQVLHRREDSQGPRHRAESREEAGRRESRSLPSRPEMEMEPLQHPGWCPGRVVFFGGKP